MGMQSYAGRKAQVQEVQETGLTSGLQRYFKGVNGSGQITGCTTTDAILTDLDSCTASTHLFLAVLSAQSAHVDWQGGWTSHLHQNVLLGEAGLRVMDMLRI